SPFSLESLRPLADFQMIGFSVTYEGDYINVLRLLAMASIPLRAADRGARDPLVLMGGVCAFSNPEPLAPFMDFVVVGEGEELVVELMAAYRSGDRDREKLLASLAAMEGIYVPAEYDVAYAADGERRVGLVGACVSDYPWIGELLKIVEENGLELSISSLRADSLTEDLVAALARGGHRTLTMAPEAGTERLRRAIRKPITDDQLMTACDLVRAHGIPNLKCYFMIGQPTET